jgi:hypothetical protein
VSRATNTHPRLYHRFPAGSTIAGHVRRIERRNGAGHFADREAIERAVARLLDDR